MKREMVYGGHMNGVPLVGRWISDDHQEFTPMTDKDVLALAGAYNELRAAVVAYLTGDSACEVINAYVALQRAVGLEPNPALHRAIQVVARKTEG